MSSIFLSQLIFKMMIFMPWKKALPEMVEMLADKMKDISCKLSQDVRIPLLFSQWIYVYRDL